jgi:hypothetical protein
VGPAVREKRQIHADFGSSQLVGLALDGGKEFLVHADVQALELLAQDLRGAPLPLRHQGVHLGNAGFLNSHYAGSQSASSTTRAVGSSQLKVKR